MEKTIINIKTDKQIKRDAQRTAKELGLPLGTILNAYLKELIREQRVVFSKHPIPNTRTQKLLQKIDRDIKLNKNTTGPFDYKEAIAYLNIL